MILCDEKFHFRNHIKIYTKEMYALFSIFQYNSHIQGFRDTCYRLDIVIKFCILSKRKEYIITENIYLLIVLIETIINFKLNLS